MKLIIAIIRPEKLNSVLEALYRAEVRGLTVTRVMGHGGETEHVETYRGTTVKVALQEKVRLEIGVSDSFVDVTIRAILGVGALRRRRGRQGVRARRRAGAPDSHRRAGRGGGDAGGTGRRLTLDWTSDAVGTGASAPVFVLVPAPVSRHPGRNLCAASHPRPLPASPPCHCLYRSTMADPPAWIAFPVPEPPSLLTMSGS